MRSWSAEGEPRRLSDAAASPDYAERVCDLACRIRAAQDTGDAVRILGLAVDRLGLDAGAFVSVIRDSDQAPAYRLLLAGDPLWASAYAQHGWFADDPWLAHAVDSTDAVRGIELKPRSAAQREFIEAASRSGFRSATIVPAPSTAGASRVGVLYLGSMQPDYFDDDSFPLLCLLARGLAMELHDWWHRRLRAEMLAQCRLTEDDLALLRHESAGHCSKVIAAALGTEAKTIDCRFQRVNAKLGVSNRRAAARLAKLYGLV